MTPEQELVTLRQQIKQAEKKYDNKPFMMEGDIVAFNPKVDKSTTAGKNFFVRELILCVTSFVNGEEYKNNVSFQLTGNACDLVESLNLSPGDTINVYFSLRGTLKDSEKKIVVNGESYYGNPDSKTCFTNLNIYKIDPLAVANPTRTAKPEPKPETKVEEIPQPEGDDLPF